MSRSEAHATWYRIGSLGEDRVYWQPGTGYSREVDHDSLVKLDDLSEVAFFDQVEDYETIVDAADTNAGLLHAMGRDLVMAFYDMADDVAFAAECEEEKRATLREGSGV